MYLVFDISFDHAIWTGRTSLLMKFDLGLKLWARTGLGQTRTYPHIEVQKEYNLKLKKNIPCALINLIVKLETKFKKKCKFFNNLRMKRSFFCFVN